MQFFTALADIFLSPAMLLMAFGAHRATMPQLRLASIQPTHSLPLHSVAT